MSGRRRCSNDRVRSRFIAEARHLLGDFSRHVERLALHPGQASQPQVCSESLHQVAEGANLVGADSLFEIADLAEQATRQLAAARLPVDECMIDTLRDTYILLMVLVRELEEGRPLAPPVEPVAEALRYAFALDDATLTLPGDRVLPAW